MRADDHPRVRSAVGPSAAWSAVHHLDEVTSTNDIALARLRDGEVPGFVVVADRQTHGRGRSGRGWEDGPSADASLMLTATVRAPEVALTLVPLAVGLAVLDAVDAVAAVADATVADAAVDAAVADADAHPAPDAAGWALKWPNDVLADGRKCAGILAERHTVSSAEGASAPVDVLLLGIGVNVDWRGSDRAGERGRWTSLAEVLDADVDRFALLGELLEALAERLVSVEDDPHGLLDAYRKRCVTLGRDVETRSAAGSLIDGRAVDVDEQGRLLVDTGRERIAITAGDVTHVRSDV